MSSLLFVKSKLTGTPIGSIAASLRNFVSPYNPDVAEVHLEEKRLPLILKRLLKEDSNCVDVGAHVGSFLSAIIKVAPRGRHTAIEAVSKKAEWLKKRFTGVTVFPVAVGDEGGIVEFEESIDRPGWSHISNGIKRTKKSIFYPVEVRRLDDIITGRIDFMKIDIEGGELSALHGAMRILEHNRPSLLFECGAEDEMRHMGHERQKLFDFITGNIGYDIFLFSDYLYDKGPMTAIEFKKAGIYPFRAFNYIALPRE